MLALCVRLCVKPCVKLCVQICVQYALYSSIALAVGSADANLSLQTLKSFKALNPEATALMSRAEKNPDSSSVFMFWAEWCPYCKGELQQLAEIKNAPELSDINFVIISVDESEAAAIKGAKEGPGGMAYFYSPDPKVREKFGVRRLPMTVVKKSDPALTLVYTGFSNERWSWIKKRIYAAAGKSAEEE